MNYRSRTYWTLTQMGIEHGQTSGNPSLDATGADAKIAAAGIQGDRSSQDQNTPAMGAV